GTSGVAWTITNLGTVESIGVQGIGISLASGGFVTNGQSGSTAGYIAGTRFGIQIKGASGRIVNYGTIRGLAGGESVYLLNGGTVTNAGTLIGRYGVGFTGAPGSSRIAFNFGLIDAYGSGFALVTGVALADPLVNTGTILATNTGGTTGAVGVLGYTLVNSGTISATGSGAVGVKGARTVNN